MNPDMPTITDDHCSKNKVYNLWHIEREILGRRVPKEEKIVKRSKISSSNSEIVLQTMGFEYFKNKTMLTK